ncbi:GntR family transcriptional regulator [Paracoccus sp. NSM]|uniref:GntR family transcriptional regulator n=1 Tax=Paracoccus sp. NSM TaxID=3457784 RepID=UPI00403623F5
MTSESGIVEDLRRRILSLDLPPGAILSRSDLTARYGTSSTPLRDALLRLRDEGLVTIMPQSRTQVTRIDLNHARQIHVLRSTVEAEATARIAAEPPDGLSDQLATLIRMQEDEARRGDMDAFARLDLAFHEALLHAARLDAVHRVIRRESVHIDRLRALHLMQPEKAQQILTDHRSILDGITAADPAAAREAMRHHLSQSILLGEQLTRERPEFFETERH